MEVHTKTETLETPKTRIHSTSRRGSSTRGSTVKSRHATTQKHKTIRTQIPSRMSSVSFSSLSVSERSAFSIPSVLISLPSASQNSVRLPSIPPTSTLSLPVSSTIPSSSCISGFYLLPSGVDCEVPQAYLALRTYDGPLQPFDFPQSCISGCLSIVGCVSFEIFNNADVGVWTCYL